MVVLENSGAMVTIGSTQYLQPDYLSPLPTTVRLFFLLPINLKRKTSKKAKKKFKKKI